MKISDLMQDANQPEQGEEDLPQEPQQEPAQAPPQPSGNPATGKLEPPSTEEEMQIKEKVVLAGTNILTEKTEDVLSMMQNKSPAKGMAAATDMIVQTISEQMGAPIPLNIALYGGVEIMQELMVFAQTSGIEVSEELFGKSAQYYIFGLLQRHNISPEEIEPMFAGTPEGEMKAMMEQQARYSMA